VVKGVANGEKFVEVQHVRSGVRVYLKRPWHDSGEGQLLALVGARHGTGGTIGANSSLRDKVTRWANDVYDPTVNSTQYMTPDFFSGSVAGVNPDDPIVVPGLGNNAHLFVFRGYPVEYDAEKELWFCDIRIIGSGMNSKTTPFLRLALAAFQPSSIGPAGDLRMSGVTVTDPIQMSSDRKVTVSGVDSVPSVRVAVNDFRLNDQSLFRIRWQTRAIEPTVTPNPAPDICIDSPWVNAATLPFTGNSASKVLLPLAAANADARAALRKGRVFTEAIEVNDLF
jgi:hypothetical protein